MIDKIETKKGTVEFPCMHPKIVPIEQVVANDYNPNHVSDSNMELLLQSVLDNGFCFPVVTIYDDILEKICCDRRLSPLPAFPRLSGG